MQGKKPQLNIFARDISSSSDDFNFYRDATTNSTIDTTSPKNPIQGIQPSANLENSNAGSNQSNFKISKEQINRLKSLHNKARVLKKLINDNIEYFKKIKKKVDIILLRQISLLDKSSSDICNILAQEIASESLLCDRAMLDDFKSKIFKCLLLSLSALSKDSKVQEARDKLREIDSYCAYVVNKYEGNILLIDRFNNNKMSSPNFLIQYEDTLKSIKDNQKLIEFENIYRYLKPSTLVPVVLKQLAADVNSQKVFLDGDEYPLFTKRVAKYGSKALFKNKVVVEYAPKAAFFTNVVTPFRGRFFIQPDLPDENKEAAIRVLHDAALEAIEYKK